MTDEYPLRTATEALRQASIEMDPAARKALIESALASVRFADKEMEALKADILRYIEISSALATENEQLRKELERN